MADAEQIKDEHAAKLTLQKAEDEEAERAECTVRGILMAYLCIALQHRCNPSMVAGSQ